MSDDNENACGLVRRIRLEELVIPSTGFWGRDQPSADAREFLVLGVGNVTNEGELDLKGATKRYLTRGEMGGVAEEGDLVVVKSSGSAANIRSGKTAICPAELSGKIACSNFMMRLKVKRDVADPYLLWLILNSQAAKTFIREIVGASTYPNIKWENYRRFEFELPRLGKQRRIAAQLREQLSILAEARTALESQLNAAESLPAAHLRAVFDTTESESWPKRTIGEMIHEGVLSEHQDGNHGELHPRNKDFIIEGVKFVTAKHISGDGTVLLRSAPCISKEQASGLRIGFAQANDVLLAHNATVGKVGIAPPECEPFVVGTSLTIYRANAEMVDPKFLFYTLTASQFQRQLVDAMKQTTRNQVPITKQRTLSLPMPAVDAQHDISAQLDDAFAVSVGLRNSLRAKLSELEKLPAALLRAAFQPSNQD